MPPAAGSTRQLEINPATRTPVSRKLSIIPALLGLWVFACTSPEPPGGASAYRATDDLGRTVALPGQPQRIVSLAPSITETLFALGLDSTVVGVTQYCNYPPEATRLPRVGGMLNPAMEDIVRLRPDLVLMSGSGNMESDFVRLTDLGLPVFVSHPRDLDGVLKSILDLGSLTGSRPRADSIVSGLRSEITRLRGLSAQKPRRTVLVLVSVRPIISAGPETFISEMIELCNAINVASNSTTAYPIMSREEILIADPERIIVTSDATSRPSDIYTAFPEWRMLRAITDSAVVIVNADIMTRPGPRIVDGLGELFHAIHGR